MNLIKLQDLHASSLEEIIRELEKKRGKLAVESEIDEIGEDHNVDEFEFNLVNNVISKPEKFGESARRIPFL